jgi:uncharacterized membrane protein
MLAQWIQNDLLASIAIRSFVLLIVTLGFALACRRRSAAINHRIWVLGFCGCLIMPAVTLLSPGWAFPVLPPVEPSGENSVAVTTPTNTFAHPQAFTFGPLSAIRAWSRCPK